MALVGHTNTGKTSLVRTLTHDRGFGEVADRGGTTRQVSVVDLAIADETLIELFDSPGLENAPELIEWLEDLPGRRHDGPERIGRLLEDRQARERFDHEARVLELVGQVDVALYVIDTREPVLEKYKDELAILGLSGRPIVALLNFVAAPSSREAEWREALSRLMLHNVVAFDAAIRDPGTEWRLLEKIATLLDEHAATIKRWMDHRREQEAKRHHAARRAIAEMLVDVAAYRQEVPETAALTEWQAMQARVSEREQHCVEILLELYRFGHEDYDDSDLPLSGGQWDADPFDTETLKYYGIRTGKYLGAGASTGAAIDIGTGGLTLGTGTLAGTLIGTGVGLTRTLGDRLLGRMRSRAVLAVDDKTLGLLATRQLHLLATLVRRGHGSQAPVGAIDKSRPVFDRLPAPLRKSRFHPSWSSLDKRWRPDTRREDCIQRLAGKMRTTGDDA